jgi:hypothetical protein
MKRKFYQPDHSGDNRTCNSSHHHQILSFSLMVTNSNTCVGLNRLSTKNTVICVLTWKLFSLFGFYLFFLWLVSRSFIVVTSKYVLMQLSDDENNVSLKLFDFLAKLQIGRVFICVIVCGCQAHWSAWNNAFPDFHLSTCMFLQQFSCFSPFT